MSLRAALGALLAVGLLGGCGGPSGDLFAVERTGAVPGARLTLIVDDGGFVRCNGGDRQQISSDQLIEAREIARALDGEPDEPPGPAGRNLTLAPRPGSILRYDVRTEGGSVAFADTSTGQPPVLFRVAQLTRALAKQVCGLPR
jgi:hypothetical protein